MDERARSEGLVHMRLQRLPRSPTPVYLVPLRRQPRGRRGRRRRRRRAASGVSSEGDGPRLDGQRGSAGSFRRLGGRASTPVTHRPVTPARWMGRRRRRPCRARAARSNPARVPVHRARRPRPGGRVRFVPVSVAERRGVRSVGRFLEDDDSRGSKRGPTDAVARTGVFPADGPRAAAFPCGRRWSRATSTAAGRGPGPWTPRHRARVDEGGSNGTRNGGWVYDTASGAPCSGRRSVRRGGRGTWTGGGTYRGGALRVVAGSFEPVGSRYLDARGSEDRRGVWRAGSSRRQCPPPIYAGAPRARVGRGRELASMTATMRAAASAAAASSTRAPRLRAPASSPTRSPPATPRPDGPDSPVGRRAVRGRGRRQRAESGRRRPRSERSIHPLPRRRACRARRRARASDPSDDDDDDDETAGGGGGTFTSRVGKQSVDSAGLGARIRRGDRRREGGEGPLDDARARACGTCRGSWVGLESAGARRRRRPRDRAVRRSTPTDDGRLRSRRPALALAAGVNSVSWLVVLLAHTLVSTPVTSTKVSPISGPHDPSRGRHRIRLLKRM